MKTNIAVPKREGNYSIEQQIKKRSRQNDPLSNASENSIIFDQYMFIKKSNSLKRVQISDIILVEVEEKYCNIITKKERFVVLISLVRILQFLDPTKFYRTHRNFIVNIHQILEIIPRDNLILLEGNYRATLSDKYKDIIKKIRTLR